MNLPIVDISKLSSSDPEARKAVGEELRAVCQDKGFFYCKGHGVPQGFIDAVFEQTKVFFDLPQEEKNKVDKAASFCNRGYEQMEGQTLEAGAKPDMKEGFYIGHEMRLDDPRVIDRRFNRGPNQWPVSMSGELVGFKPVMQGYFAAMIDLGERLVCGLALSLELDEHHFDDFCIDPLAILRLLHYPPQEVQDATEQIGAGAHTDFGGLTILLQDDNGGLEVWDIVNDCWISAEPVPGAFVINLGDMISRWTNDTYRSTLHRVINSSGKERYSIPFFYTGNPDFVVSCIETCLIGDETPKYPPIKVEDHLAEMYRQTYSS